MERTICIDNMIVWANVGVGQNERQTPQKLRVDVIVRLLPAYIIKDCLSCTINYSEVKQRVEKVVTGIEYTLIETIASAILKPLLVMKDVTEVEVKISKITVWDNATPAVILKDRRTI